MIGKLLVQTVREVRARLKEEKMQQRLHRVLFDDPLTLEMCELIAKNTGNYFEVINRDGVTLRWTRHGFAKVEESSEEWEA